MSEQFWFYVTAHFIEKIVEQNLFPSWFILLMPQCAVSLKI